MNSPKNVGLSLAIMVLAAWASAEAEPLSVVAVKAPVVNCVFHKTRTVPVTVRLRCDLAPSWSSIPPCLVCPWYVSPDGEEH